MIPVANDSPRDISEFDTTPRPDSYRGPLALFPDPSPRSLVGNAMTQVVVEVRPEKQLFSTKTPHRPIGNRVYQYTKDITAPDLYVVEAIFKEANETAQDFDAVLRQTSQLLYERKAAPGTVAASHKLQAARLQDGYKKLRSAKLELRANVKFIPFLNDPKLIASALRSLFTFNAIRPEKKRKYEELHLLLTAPEHTQALEFYKRLKKQCKDLRNLPTPQAKVTGLEAIYEEAIQKISSVLNEKKEEKQKDDETLLGKSVIVFKQTTSLYLELLRFISYTSTFPNKAPKVGLGWKIIGYGSVWGTPAEIVNPNDIGPLAIRIAHLKEKVDKQDSEVSHAQELALADNAVRNIAASVLADPTDSYLALCEQDPLSDEDKFRGGGRLQLAIYSEMATEIRSLYRVAKALARELATLEARTKELCAGTRSAPKLETFMAEIPHLEALIIGLEARITEQHDKIKALPLSSKIQAGWYYVAKLREKANDVRMYLKHFKKIANAGFLPYSMAMYRLMNYLDPQKESLRRDSAYFTSPSAVKRLYKALQATNQLLEPMQHRRFREKLAQSVYTTVDEILAKVGPRSLKAANNEIGIPRRLLARELLATFQADNEIANEYPPKVIQSYLLKGFINQLYYLKKPNIDPEFEVTLHILLTDPHYAVAMRSMCQKLPLFADLLADYKASSDMDKFTSELDMMKKALQCVAWKPNSNNNNISKLFHYCQVQQILDDLYKSPYLQASAQQAKRLNWLKQQISYILVSTSFGYPAYFSEFQSIDVQFRSASVRLEPKMQSHETRGPILYKLITRSLYAHAIDDRVNATRALLSIIDVLNIEDLPTMHLKQLLLGWTLEQYMQTPRISTQHSEMLLADLFDDYLKNDQSREFWRDLHGIGFMELALYRLKNLMEQTQVATRNSGIAAYETWKAVMHCYDNFTKEIDLVQGDPDNPYGRINSLVKLARERFKNGLPTEGLSANLDAALWCVIDIITSYVRLRHEEFTSLIRFHQHLAERPADPEDIQRHELGENKAAALSHALEETKAYNAMIPYEAQKAYDDTKKLLDDVINAFGPEIPLDMSVLPQNPKLKEARKLVADIRIKFSQHALPWRTYHAKYLKGKE